MKEKTSTLIIRGLKRLLMNNLSVARPTWQHHALLVCGLFISLWSFVVCVSWRFHHHPLIQSIVEFSFPSTLLTAVFFFLCGCGFIAAYFYFFKTAKVFGCGVALFSFFLLVQSFGGLGLVVLPYLIVSSAAYCFVLVGICLWSLGGFVKRSGGPLVLNILSSLLVAVAFISLMGSVSGVGTDFLWNALPQMSIASALAFLFIGTVLFFYSCSLLKDAESFSAWIALPVGAFIFLAASLFAGALLQEQKKTIAALEAAEGKALREKILADLKKSGDALEHVARVWVFNKGSSRLLWEEEAKFLISKLQGLEAVLWINKENRLIWIERSGDEKTPFFLNEKTMEGAKEGQKLALSSTYNEKGELFGFILYFPLFVDASFDGFIAGVFDIKKFLKASMPSKGNNYDISVFHNSEALIKEPREGSQKSSSLSSQQPVNMSGLNLDVVVRADDGVLGKWEPHVPKILIFGSLPFMALAAFLIHYALKSKKLSVDFEHAFSQLDRANSVIAEQDRLVSLGSLAAGIAHEVKNPLSIMKSFSELSVGLLEEVNQTLEPYTSLFKQEDKERLGESLGTLQTNLVRICDQSKRATNTIQRMLAHTRANQEPALTDIHALIDEYLTLCYYSVRAQDPAFNVKFTKRYDAQAPKIYIVAEDMGRVFLNLFNNAFYALSLKKKREGSRYSPELMITTQYLNKEFLDVRIRDNGKGIPDSVKSKIFSPFFTTKPVGTGTGLGLSICHTIVIDHGGTLDFVSKEGEFTEFRIVLPVKFDETSSQ
jgi:signal transduction histidine kinase